MRRLRGGGAEAGGVSRPVEPAARYPIRAVALRTGLGTDTLRAWERRHGAVAPVRDERGRMYSEADVVRLRLLRAAVEQGHRIGRLAALGDGALRQLTASRVPGGARTGAAAIDTVAIDAALHHYDAASLDREIARLAAGLSPLELLVQVIGPLLTRVGDEWQQGGSGIAREHLLSSATRHILGSLLRLQTRRHVPARLVFATLAGDRHEIGTLGAALLAANSGLGVTYLGPDLPAAELISSATRAGVRAVVLGLTTAPAERATVRELRAIVAGLPAGVEVWAGGRGAVRTSSLVGGKVLILHDYFQYQQQLVRLGGQDT